MWCEPQRTCVANHKEHKEHEGSRNFFVFFVTFVVPQIARRQRPAPTRLPFGVDSVVAASFVMSLLLSATASAQSALADRIAAGDRQAALAMIAEGADVNQTQLDGSTPLHWAVYRVDRELVAALLKKRARANVVNRYGASPLTEAA